MLKHILRKYSILPPLGLACLVLASCDDHDGCHGCGNFTPVEFSNGVVAADLNGDGLPDIVALSPVQPIVSSTPSNIKTYLATSAGAYGAPTFTAGGLNP